MKKQQREKGRSLQTFIEFSDLVDPKASAPVSLKETPTPATSAIARVIYRKIQRLHFEVRNTQHVDPTVELLSQQATSIASLLLLVLDEADANLLALARATQ